MKTITHLKQVHAAARAAMIEPGLTSYKTFLKLLKGQNYQVAVQSCFTLKQVENLFIDFNGAQLCHVHVNGCQVEQAKKNYQGYFVNIPSKFLKLGINKCFIYAKKKYRQDGNGMVSFTDASGQQFFYTQSQPYHANKIWPIFDQPDIKAKMQLSVIYHNSGIVVSNQNQEKQATSFKQGQFLKKFEGIQLLKQISENVPQDYNFVSFEQTPLIAPYLFAVVGGPYKRLKCPQPYKGKSFDLLTYGQRYQDLKRYAPFIWQLAIQGTKFFQQFFDYPHSFSKHQMIFLNQYKWGGMENVGLITLNDNYLEKGTPTMARIQVFANVIVHQLAHMWFGNLVTMKWWDDLWLNQSFADSICNFAIEKIKDKITAFQIPTASVYFNSAKNWGYSTDQMATTHPIHVHVQNTDDAQQNFDGITYSKGAAVIKILLFLLGQENFSKGIAYHFKKYAYSNATFNDFLQSMQQFFPIKQFTLKQWKQSWINTAGLNSLQIQWDPKIKSDKSKMIIKQAAVLKQHPTLRYHLIKVGLITESGDIDSKTVMVKPQPLTQIQFDNSKGYVAVFSNYQDHDFAKMVLDPISRVWISKNISLIKCDLSRAMLWRAFYQTVRDGLSSAKSYIDMVINQVGKENDQLFQKQITYMKIAMQSFIPKKHRQPFLTSAFDFLYKQIKQAKTPARALVAANNIALTAKNIQQIQTLLDWFDGKIFQQKKPSITQGWTIIKAIFDSKDFTQQNKWNYFNKMSQIDNSMTKLNNEHRFKAMSCSDQKYTQTFNRLTDVQNYKSHNQSVYTSLGLTSLINSQRYSKIKKQFFQKVVKISQNPNTDFVKFVINYVYCDKQDQLQMDLNNWKKCLQKINSDVAIRNIRQQMDILQRRIRCYEQYQKQKL